MLWCNYLCQNQEDYYWWGCDVSVTRLLTTNMATTNGYLRNVSCSHKITALGWVTRAAVMGVTARRSNDLPRSARWAWSSPPPFSPDSFYIFIILTLAASLASFFLSFLWTRNVRHTHTVTQTRTHRHTPPLTPSFWTELRRKWPALENLFLWGLPDRKQ